MTYRLWTSLEPDPRSATPTRGAQAPLSDPAFLLGRQWQFGEFTGTDGGDPVFGFIDYQHSDFAIHRAAGGDAVPMRPRTPPIAALMGVPTAAHLDDDGPQMARMSLRLGRILLTRAQTREAEPELREAIKPIPAWTTLTPGPMIRAAAMRSGQMPLDGVAILRAFSASREHWPDHEALKLDILALLVALGLSVPEGEAARTRPMTPAERLRERLRERHAERERMARGNTRTLLEHFQDAIGDLTGNFDKVLAETLHVDGAVRVSQSPRPGAGDSFDANTLSHRLSLTFDETMDFGGQITTPQGRPSWWALDQISINDTDTEKRATVIPTRLSFPGQPTDRFWQRQDSTTDWQSTQAGATDLPRMVAGLALSQVGPHTFVLPLTVPRGGQVAVSDVILQDTFGDQVRHRGATKGPNIWSALRRSRACQITDFLDADPLEGDAIRAIALVPEDMTDRVWAIARTVPNAQGRGEAVFESITPPNPPEHGEAPHYHLRQPPPSTWLPLVWDESAGVYRPSPITTGPILTALETDITGLRPGVLPRTGLELRHVWRAGRDRTGRLVTWLARDLRPADEARASGLAFDRLVLPSDKA